MKRILCLFGLHDWNTIIDLGSSDVRLCKRCWKKQRKYLYSGWLNVPLNTQEMIEKKLKK